jgi:hypothetical protein
MAKKNNAILYIGAAAIAVYIFKDKLFGAKAADESTEVTKQDAKDADQVIDATAPGSSVTQAIATAKEIAQGFKDVKVLIKTPRGKKDIVLSKGKKKRMARRAARKVKGRKSKSKKAQIIIEPTQSSFSPFPTTPSYLSPTTPAYQSDSMFFSPTR